MLGAIIGDIIGSVVEFNPIRTTEFEALNPKCEFTDDSVLTLATARSAGRLIRSKKRSTKRAGAPNARTIIRRESKGLRRPRRLSFSRGREKRSRK